MEEQGQFYIQFEDLLMYYNGIFLNWNPSLFKFKTAIHENWPLSVGPLDDAYYKGDNPQYSLIIDPQLIDANLLQSQGNIVTIWVLLSRHVTSNVDSDNEVFMAMHIYKKRHGQRIYGASTKKYIKGVYSNNPHDLVRIDVDMTNNADTKDMTIVLSQLDRVLDVNYTLSIFGTNTFRFFRTPTAGVYKYDFTGKFVENECGSMSPEAFFMNPQFYIYSGSSNSKNEKIKLHLEAFYTRTISCSIDIISVPKSKELILAGNKPSRVYSVDVRDKDNRTSGAYRQGYCYITDILLQPEMFYVVILSTYMSSMAGSYRFNCISNTNKIRCEGIPR